MASAYEVRSRRLVGRDAVRWHAEKDERGRGGGPGLILATPLLAVIMVLVQMVYIEDVLGDRKTEVKEKGIEKQSQATAKGPEATAANPEPATIAAEER